VVGAGLMLWGYVRSTPEKYLIKRDVE